jgi:DNA-binding FrmR family transcriptional regulator
MPDTIHHTHPEILKRLKRVEGQIRSIVAMIEAGRSCVDVAQQFAAATSAIASAKDTFIRDHIDHCLNGSHDDLEAQLLELKAITKYL